MTQPVSRSARWPGAELTCSESSRAESEPLTCDETRELSCAAERAHLIALTEPLREASDSDTPHTVADPRGAGFCGRANTVVEGFLCNDRVVVSNACRKPNNAFDEFVCDEPKMERLQWAILRETWTFVKTIALSLVRAKP
jgi:hypothetical protein